MRTAALALLQVGCLWLGAGALGQQVKPVQSSTDLPLPASAHPVSDPDQLRSVAAELSGLAQASLLRGPCQDHHFARLPLGHGSGLDAIGQGFFRAGYIMTTLPEGGTDQLAFTLTRRGRMLIGLLTFAETETTVAWCRLPDQKPVSSPR